MIRKSISNIPKEHAGIILESIADGVFTVDANMVITYFNRAAEKITGVKREEALGHFCYEVLRSNICETMCPLRSTFKTEQDIIDKHKNILTNDGRQKTVSISTSVLKDENGKVIGGVETFRDLSTIEVLKKEINKNYTFEDIVSKNREILRLFDILPNIAESESTVLIEGASGSGKELFARAIHNLSFRKDKPFVAVNCGALPDSLLESELFGYVKGAFTDAKTDKPGRFARAERGTIFLDEIDSLTKSTQVKLLRVLQEKEFEPLGATSVKKSNVRVIAATSENLNELVREKDFRDDLYYRLNIVKIKLPALVDRRDDIPLLVNHFIEKFNHKMNRMITGISDDVLKILMRYDFPGNVRELENIIEHSFVMCSNIVIQVEHLPAELIEREIEDEMDRRMSYPLNLTERKLIIDALQKNNWNRNETADELGLNRSTLWRKMKKYKII
ncbi:MAG: sigma 54-interacting transcriptional regulator [Ignavibacteriae bacterium]|nr:PAS domain S-box protein [Ignavibacteriota bacterium]NOG96462.1 sigma 54-interacting transcriptional regulator [Ignavibacteriota bacterium]